MDSDWSILLTCEEKIKMISVNQMAAYHMIMYVFNLIHNSYSEQIQNTYIYQERHSLRKNANNFVSVAEKPMPRCTYCGAKLFNNLPNDIRETQDRTGYGYGRNSHPIRQKSDYLFVYLFTL